MPRNPSKKQRIKDHREAAGDDCSVSFGDLGVDLLANVFAFLPVEEIMPKRRINKKSREAVEMTTPPPHDFVVNCMDKYNAMNVMTRAMPNLQKIKLSGFGYRHKYNDGEDPNEEEVARTAYATSHDIELISNFSKLQMLTISSAPLNGRYPALFNFPLLQKLDIHHCNFLKFDLEMLAGLPSLKELCCECNSCMTGNINSLRLLKESLDVVHIQFCCNIVGNIMDLADFPNLKELELYETAVTGDIRDIGENDFTTLEQLALPHGVYGESGYKLQRISDGPELIRAVYLLSKQRPALMDMEDWSASLSEDSPEWYDSEVTASNVQNLPPFYIVFVQAGSRTGYRWTNSEWRGNPCEVNWLDPEPDRESSDYWQYIEELQKIENEVRFYRGFHQPPTEQEYHRLLEERGIHR